MKKFKFSSSHTLDSHAFKWVNIYLRNFYRCPKGRMVTLTFGYRDFLASDKILIEEYNFALGGVDTNSEYASKIKDHHILYNLNAGYQEGY